jgi:hypothetical protein
VSIQNIPSDVAAVLPGIHVSADTAYVVADYPYGFRLRCSIRYWLDISKHGVRLMSQTTNPKVPGVRWNKPKASTYQRFAGALYLDSVGHVQWAGLGEYSDAAEAVAYRDMFRAGVPQSMLLGLDAWVAAKVAYEAASAANGGDMRASAAVARAAFVQVIKAAGPDAAKLANGAESV